MSAPKVSVIIVSYNTREKLRRCLLAVEHHHEVIVVDNNSKDGSPEMVETDFAHVHLIRSPLNLGFGKANNVGMEHAKGKLVLFLNSDCYPDPGSIDQVARAFDDKAVIAAGGRLLNPDGSLQESVAGRLTLWAVFTEQFYIDSLLRVVAPNLAYWRTNQAYDRANPYTDVDQVMGACLMVRPVERFNERFFLYCEDTELCYRLRRSGRIVYVPRAVFVHELGSSSVGVERWRSVARYNRGKELFFEIHDGTFAALICRMLNRCGAFLRLIAWSLAWPFLPRYRQLPKLFWRVLTCPKTGPKNS